MTPKRENWLEATSMLCPKCGKYGKGPLTYHDGSMVVRHTTKPLRPGKLEKQIKYCVLSPAKGAPK